MPRDLEATIEISVSPERVWTIMGDPRRMPQFSPQCRRTLLPGGVRPGGWMININRQGWKFWATTGKIVRLEPNRALAFRINENHSVWSFELAPSATGTTLTQRRSESAGITWISRMLVDLVLGGNDRFETALEAGMNTTLGRIKTAAESS
jgi:uncharacterized protein YndB with AHSA1/START domain